MARSRVSVVPAPPQSIDQAVRTAIERVGGFQALRGIPHILIKPNLGWDLPLPGAVTNGHVIAAVVKALLDEGHTLTIIEADQVLVDVSRAARQAGIFGLTDTPGVRWMNLSQGKFIEVLVDDAVSCEPIRVPQIVTEHPLVTIPVLKTHAKTVISGAVKNHWGLLPIDRYRLHPKLTEVLTDLIRAVPPSLCLMDATVALEGNGPKSGHPRRIDHVLASTDPLALDRTAAQLMGIRAEEVPHLARLAAILGHPLSATVLGELPRVAPFARADHNLVSQVEERLNSSTQSSFFTHPAAFRLMCSGARVWYHAWFHWGPGLSLREAVQPPAKSSTEQSS